MADGLNLDGKVAIVTGAAGGIGSETARLLGERGANVVLADLSGTKLAEAEATVVGGTAAHHEVDISSEEDVQALIAFTVETFGRLDIVHNNAARQGLIEDAQVLDMTVELWDSVFAVNGAERRHADGREYAELLIMLEGVVRLLGRTNAAECRLPYTGLVHVNVNRDICQGHARCYALCPEIFELDELGFALAQDHRPVPVEFEAQVRRAALNCPENAISAEE